MTNNGNKNKQPKKPSAAAKGTKTLRTQPLLARNATKKTVMETPKSKAGTRPAAKGPKAMQPPKPPRVKAATLAFASTPVSDVSEAETERVLSVQISPDVTQAQIVFSTWAAHHHTVFSGGNNRDLEALFFYFASFLNRYPTPSDGLRVFPRFLLDVCAALAPKRTKIKGHIIAFNMSAVTFTWNTARNSMLTNMYPVLNWSSIDANGSPKYDALATSATSHTTLANTIAFLDRYSSVLDCVPVLTYTSPYVNDCSAFAFVPITSPIVTFSPANASLASGTLGQTTVALDRVVALEVPIKTPWLACLGFGTWSADRCGKHTWQVLSAPGSAVWAILESRDLDKVEKQKDRAKALYRLAHRIRVKFVQDADIFCRMDNLFYRYSEINNGGTFVNTKSPMYTAGITSAMFFDWFNTVCGALNGRFAGCMSGSSYISAQDSKAIGATPYPTQCGLAPRIRSVFDVECLEWVVEQFSRLTAFEVSSGKGKGPEALEIPFICSFYNATDTTHSDWVNYVWIDDTTLDTFKDTVRTNVPVNAVHQVVDLIGAATQTINPYINSSTIKNIELVTVAFLGMADRCKVASWPSEVTRLASLTPFTVFTAGWDLNYSTGVIMQSMSSVPELSYDPELLIQTFAVPRLVLLNLNDTLFPFKFMQWSGEERYDTLSFDSSTAILTTKIWDLVERLIYNAAVIPSQLIAVSGVAGMGKPKASTSSSLGGGSGGQVPPTTTVSFDFTHMMNEIKSHISSVTSFHDKEEVLDRVKPLMNDDEFSDFINILTRPQSDASEQTLLKLVTPLVPIKGNYCGPGWSAGSRLPPVLGAGEVYQVRPIDDEDAICLLHDSAYAKARDNNDLLDADAAMVSQLRRVKQRSGLSLYGRAMETFFNAKLRALRPWAYEDNYRKK